MLQKSKIDGRFVWLFSKEPDLELEGLLKRHYTTVAFFQGTMMNAVDLERVKVPVATYSARFDSISRVQIRNKKLEPRHTIRSFFRVARPLVGKLMQFYSLRAIYNSVTDGRSLKEVEGTITHFGRVDLSLSFLNLTPWAPLSLWIAVPSGSGWLFGIWSSLDNNLENDFYLRGLSLLRLFSLFHYTNQTV